MRKLGILIGLMAFTIICGAISAGFLDAPLGGLLIKQTANPDASPFSATPVQAFQLVAWVGFILVNMIGMGLTIAAFFWLTNRALANARRNAPAAPAATNAVVTNE